MLAARRSAGQRSCSVTQLDRPERESQSLGKGEYLIVVARVGTGENPHPGAVGAAIGPAY